MLADASDLLSVAADIGYPVVIKPRDGAGSKDVWLCPPQCSVCGFKKPFSPWPRGAILSGRCRELPLCGPNGVLPMPACGQRLSDDGRFRYLGGSCPLEPVFAWRAESLAAKAIASLPKPLGYIGVDLVLGHDPNGQADVVIEINPRLTTSYAGLRAVAESNLAAAMLAIAEGRHSDLVFSDRVVQFDADGRGFVSES